MSSVFDSLAHRSSQEWTLLCQGRDHRFKSGMGRFDTVPYLAHCQSLCGESIGIEKILVFGLASLMTFAKHVLTHCCGVLSWAVFRWAQYCNVRSVFF